MNPDIRRILIVRTDRIGDVILTLPMAQVLKEKWPSLRVSMLIRHYTRELVAGNRNVDNVLYYDTGNRRVPFLKMVSELRARSFDAVVLTYPRFRLALLMILARIPVRVGTGYRWYSFLFTDRVFEHRKDARRHELEYNLRLLRVFDDSLPTESIQPVIEVDEKSRADVISLLRGMNIEPEHRLVVLHPGSGGSARDWPVSHFRDLARLLSRLPDVRVVVTGGAGEVVLAEQVVGNESAVVSLAGKLTLPHLAALASVATVFIGNSTGPLHIAAAVGAFVIGLYPQVTPLSPARWSPVTSRKIIFTPSGKPADCSICESRKMHSCECMSSISVDSVFEGARKILSK